MNNVARLDMLELELTQLATFGSTDVQEEHLSCLVRLGVVRSDSTTKLCMARSEWLDDAVPIQEPLGLLRVTLLRDPKYRMHLDLYLSSVLHVIGKTERWQRLEALLGGKFIKFAPRFVALMEWLSLKTAKNLQEITNEDWQHLADHKNDFDAWDEHLWGISGDASRLFPLLEELYLPLIDHPVFSVAEDLDGLAKDIICAASNNEGVYCPRSDVEVLVTLMGAGFPLQWIEEQDSSYTVGLSGYLQIDSQDTCPERARGFAYGIPKAAQKSQLLSEASSATEANMFDLITEKKGLNGFVGIPQAFTRWPEVEDSPITLPTGKLLKDLALSRQQSQDSAFALENLGNHLFFGFWLQLLLLEALDRELGEETLIIAPPMNWVVEDIEAESHVLYRPRVHNDNQSSFGTLDLGNLDAVLQATTKNLGIDKFYYPFITNTGLWPWGLKLLRSVDIVEGRHDRWSLAGHVLDRLHSGSLMNNVIRQGQGLRDRLHETLQGLWEEQSRQLVQEDVVYA